MTEDRLQRGGREWAEEGILNIQFPTRNRRVKKGPGSEDQGTAGRWQKLRKSEVEELRKGRKQPICYALYFSPFTFHHLP